MKVIGGIVCSLLVACNAPGPTAVAFRDVTVVDVRDGSLRPGQTVLVVGNRIRAIGATREIELPHDTDVIEAEGGYLVPGLWDMHVHSVANVVPEAAVDSVVARAWHFPLFLAHGVTGVRDMNDGTGDVTLRLTRSIKRRLIGGDLEGPARFFAAGPSVDGDPPLGSNPVVVRTPVEARAVVESLASNGSDFIKVYENLSRDAYIAILDEARRRGIPVDGHVPFRLTPVEAARAGQRTVEHPDMLALACSSAAGSVRDRFARVLADYDDLSENERFLVQFRLYRALYDTRDPATCMPVAEAFRERGVAVTADLVAYDHVVHAEEILADESGMRLVPRAVRRGWEEWFESEVAREFQSILEPIIPLELENVRLFNEAGVTLLAGTDVGVPLQIPGLGLHRELARLVEAGLTPLEALQTATLNPARVLSLEDSLGTVEPEKLADLVLLAANPLEDIANITRIRVVVADGKVYRRADLDRLLAEARVSSGPVRGPE